MMKNILVLTDFSENAKSAERYAVQLAIRIKAGVVLFNAYPMHITPVADTLLWPHDEPASLELQSISNLQSRVDELNDELDEIHGNIYRPLITHLGDAIPLTNNLDEVIVENDIWLVIMGTNGEGLANKLLAGSHVFKIIDNISCPVLIIPRRAEYKDPQKIVYATDIKSADSAIIDWLEEFCDVLKSALFVVHVSKDTVLTKDNSGKKNTANMTNRVTHETLFMNIEGKSIKDSLYEITGQIKAGMLALMHRKYDFFDSLFHTSTSRKMITNSQIPVLIFPDNSKAGNVLYEPIFLTRKVKAI